MSDLKPCPFCGSEYQVERRRWNEWTNRIECSSCYCRTEHFSTKEEASKVWNTRPIEDELKSEIAELLLSDKRNTEICEAQDKRIVELSNARIEDAWTIAEQAKEIKRLNGVLRSDAIGFNDRDAEIERLKKKLNESVSDAEYCRLEAKIEQLKAENKILLEYFDMLETATGVVHPCVERIIRLRKEAEK